MHIIQCIEYIAYKQGIETMHIKQCIEYFVQQNSTHQYIAFTMHIIQYNAYDIMHLIQCIQNNAYNTMYRIHCI